MSGTNFRSGVCVRKQYSGSAVQGDKSALAAATKLIRRSAVIRCDAQTTETPTAFVFPAKAIVHEVMLNVIIPEATITVNVGLMGAFANPQAYALALSAASVGIKNGSLLDGFITLGDYLYEETGVGADVAYARAPDLFAGNGRVSYSCSAGASVVAFDIMIDYSEVVEEVQ